MLRPDPPLPNPVAATDFEPPLDPGIAEAVGALRAGGVETFESCEGGAGHAFPEPTVRFYGLKEEGWRALSVAVMAGLRVFALRRVWDIVEGEPTGPHWEMVFSSAHPSISRDRA